MSDGIGAIPHSPQPESMWETRIDLGSVRDAVHQLEKRVDRQNAVIMALSEIIREQTAWSTEELLLRIQSLIAAQKTTAVRKCPECGRSPGAKRSNCMYCGAVVPMMGIEDLL